MKKLRILVCFLLIFSLVLGFQAAAAQAEDRTYVVRIFAGNQGTINGSNVLELHVKHGERVDFSPTMVTLNAGSKYYVRGIREAGHDNDTVAPSFEVYRDMDFVVAYGLMSSYATYTVNYVDAKGKELAKSETFIGNVGDKPVTAYKHIEGYTPRFYNLTGTLKEGNNEWSFIYDLLIRTPEPPPEPTPTETPEGQETQGTQEDDKSVPATEASSGNDSSAAPSGDPAAPNNEPAASAEEPPKQVEEIHDLDSEPVITEEPKSSLSAPVIIGISAGTIAIAGIVFWAASRARKKKSAVEK